MIDTVDLVVVGSYYGRGKRVGFYGALLLATYNKKNDIFETITKCGTGFKDKDLQKLSKMMKEHRIKKKHSRVTSLIKADVWFRPFIVIEILGSEITLSPIHTCARNIIREGHGLAIRFPRFTGTYRLDKVAKDATTVDEILKMYKKQLKKING